VNRCTGSGAGTADESLVAGKMVGMAARPVALVNQCFQCSILNSAWSAVNDRN
jgi:hypothetical protein